MIKFSQVEMNIIIIIITCIYNAPDPKDSKRRIITPGHWANIIHSYNLSQLPGEYTAQYVQPLGATGLINHLYPHRYPFILLGWREAITVKCLAQGHKYHSCSQDSNPHSDDSAIRTQVRCTKPLGHGTAYIHTYIHQIPLSYLGTILVLYPMKSLSANGVSFDVFSTLTIEPTWRDNGKTLVCDSKVPGFQQERSRVISLDVLCKH